MFNWKSKIQINRPSVATSLEALIVDESYTNSISKETNEKRELGSSKTSFNVIELSSNVTTRKW